MNRVTHAAAPARPPSQMDAGAAQELAGRQGAFAPQIGPASPLLAAAAQHVGAVVPDAGSEAALDPMGPSERIKIDPPASDSAFPEMNDLFRRFGTAEDSSDVDKMQLMKLLVDMAALMHKQDRENAQYDMNMQVQSKKEEQAAVTSAGKSRFTGVMIGSGFTMGAGLVAFGSGAYGMSEANKAAADSLRQVPDVLAPSSGGGALGTALGSTTGVGSAAQGTAQAGSNLTQTASKVTEAADDLSDAASAASTVRDKVMDDVSDAATSVKDAAAQSGDAAALAKAAPGGLSPSEAEQFSRISLRAQLFNQLQARPNLTNQALQGVGSLMQGGGQSGGATGDLQASGHDADRINAEAAGSVNAAKRDSDRDSAQQSADTAKAMLQAMKEAGQVEHETLINTARAV